MEITKTDVVVLPLKDLHNNTGQIEGVPANPRLLRDDAYKALLQSLKEDNLTGVLPLKVYKHEGEWVVLGGNMRLRALQELKAQEVSCIVVPEDTDAATLRKIVITDNSTFGEWDMDLLANDWDTQELDDWGVELPHFEDKGVKDLSDQIQVEHKVEITCTCEKEQEDLYNEMTERGYACRLLTL